MANIVKVIVFLLCIFSSVNSRKLTTQPWPGCDKDKNCKKAKDSGNLSSIVYTKASTPQHDNLHYVFSTLELPTVILVRTSGYDSNMVFDWEKILNGSSLVDAITFTNPKKIKVPYKFGVAFTKLIEYDDIHDSANIDDSEKHKDVSWKVTPFSNMFWMSPDIDKKKNTLVFNISDSDQKWENSNNGSMSFSFQIQSEDGRNPLPPAQKFSHNETLFELTLDQLTTSFNHSRFAIEIAAVSLDTGKMGVETISTIDDEYSPGVFLLTNWLTKPADNSKSGFIQWKPVCYLSQDRARKSSSKIKRYNLKDFTEKDDKKTLSATLLSAIFGDDLFNDKSATIKKINISFGLPKDGFYKKNNFTVWSAAIGYGNPPKDTISLTVIIIISAGLGIPVILIIFGGLFTIIRKMKKKNSDYEPINGSHAVN